MNSLLKTFGFLVLISMIGSNLLFPIADAQNPDDAQPFSGQNNVSNTQETPSEEEEYEYVPEHEGIGLEMGLLVGTSIWATKSSADGAQGSSGDIELEPGFSGQLRFAYEVFTGLSVETYFSALYNTVKGQEKTFLWNYGFSAGFRYAFINRSPIVPYLSTHAQISLWTGDGCQDEGGIQRCGTQFSNELSFVTGGMAGVIFELNSSFALELGSRFDVSFPGSVFPEVQFYISPFGGMMFYF